MPALSLTCIYPTSSTLRLRWFLVLATVTYLSKLPLTHTLAALSQREILWVMPFPGTPSLVESGVIVLSTAVGRKIMLSPHPTSALAADKNRGRVSDTARPAIISSSPGASSPAYEPAARGLTPVRCPPHHVLRWFRQQWSRRFQPSPVPPAVCQNRQTRHRQ